MSVAFGNLPTRSATDSDPPHATGGGGKVGVAIDSLARHGDAARRWPIRDLDVAADQTRPGGRAAGSTSWSPEAAGIGRRNADHRTVQNDILQGGTRGEGPRTSPAGAVDADDQRGPVRYCRRSKRTNWKHDLDQRLITSARPGADPPPRGSEFTLGGRIAYAEGRRISRRTPGSTVRPPGCRSFFAAHMDVFEEVAKFPAARRIVGRDSWRALRGAGGPRSWTLRFHNPDGGVHVARAAAEQTWCGNALEAMERRVAGRGDAVAAHHAYDEAGWGLPSAAAAESWALHRDPGK